MYRFVLFGMAFLFILLLFATFDTSNKNKIEKNDRKWLKESATKTKAKAKSNQNSLLSYTHKVTCTDTLVLHSCML